MGFLSIVLAKSSEILNALWALIGCAYAIGWLIEKFSSKNNSTPDSPGTNSDSPPSREELPDRAGNLPPRWEEPPARAGNLPPRWEEPPARASMEAFEIRASTLSDYGGNPCKAIVIEARGLMPVSRRMEIKFVCSIADVTDDHDGEPVYCSADGFQQAETAIFESERKGGILQPNHGYPDWTEVGVAPADALTFPNSGWRTLRIECHLSEDKSLSEHSLVHGACLHRFHFGDTGYKEWEEKRLEALELSLRLGMATATVDDKFDVREGRLIQDWLSRRVKCLPDSERSAAKIHLNSVMKQLQEASRKRSIPFIATAKKLKASPVHQAAYDALELCTMVMAADGVMKPDEIALIDKLAALLDIDRNALRGLRDKHAQSAFPAAECSQEERDLILLGVDQDLSGSALRKELRELFARYNGLLQIEKTREKRLRYQEILDAIARVFNKNKAQ